MYHHHHHHPIFLLPFSLDIRLADFGLGEYGEAHRGEELLRRISLRGGGRGVLESLLPVKSWERKLLERGNTKKRVCICTYMYV